MRDNYGKFFLLIAFLFFTTVVFSQDEQGILKMKGMVDHGYKNPLAGVKVSVKQSGSNVKTVRTDRDGLFTLEMDIGKKYTIEFSKEEFVTKKIFVDASVPEGRGGDWQVEFSIGLFKMYPGLDISALDNPVTKIKYIEDERGFGYDRIYTEKMMAKIDKIMRQLEALKEEAYRKILRNGDQHFDDKEYSQAIDYYKEALNVRPDDNYPKRRLRRARKLLEDKKENQALYDKAIARADQLFSQKKYEEARNTYYEALDYNPTKEYPEEQIKKIKEILAELRAKEQAEKEKLENYNRFIRLADQQFEGKSYSQAKNYYQQALGIFSEKPYPKEQISKINDILAQQAQQQARNQKYNNLIKEADEFFSGKSYTQAKSKYNEALGLKPNEAYPEEQISKIDDILANQEAKERQYDNLINQADNAFEGEKYSNAKNLYQDALDLKSGEEYPRTQIAKIDEILRKQKEKDRKYNEAIAQADAAFERESYEEAKGLYSEALFIKPNEQYPKDQIDKIDGILSERQAEAERYKNAIASGDRYFESEQYNLAKNSYREALEVKPSRQYPKDQIGKIDDILARQVANEQKYNNLISEADAAFDRKDYTDSKKKYQSALEVKPGETYPKQRIDRINELLAQLEKKKEKDRKYNEAIAQADAAFERESYEEAKGLYSEALFIKPNEQYPKDQIDKIDQLLADLQRKKAEQEKINKAYNEAVKKADAMFSMEEYSQAKSLYNEALTYKPEEQYPRDRIDKINSILAEMEAEKKAYENAIARADRLFGEEEYESSKSAYQKALDIRPEEQYPQNRIDKINDILAERMAQRKRQQEIDRKYKNAIETADRLFNTEEYEDAKIAYNEALNIKPEEQYPKQKISEIENILKRQQEQIEDTYKQAIAEADDYFDNEKYNEAKSSYQKALDVKPNEQYPKNQISKIEDILKRLARQREEQARKERLYAEEIDKADQYYDKSDYHNAKSHYQKALQYKPNEEYPKNKIKLIDQKLRQFEEAKKRRERKEREEKIAAEKQKDSKLRDMNFKTKAERDKYLSRLAKEYPEGVTVENYDLGKRKVKRVIVNYDGVATEYRRVKHDWGGLFFFRNGQSISKAVFESETEEK